MTFLKIYIIGVLVCFLITLLFEHLYYGNGRSETVHLKTIGEDFLYSLLSWLGVLGEVDGGLPLFNGSQRGMTHASSFTHHGGRYPPPYASKLQVLTQNHQRFPGFGHQQCLSRSHESLLRLKSISYILAFIAGYINYTR